MEAQGSGASVLFQDVTLSVTETQSNSTYAACISALSLVTGGLWQVRACDPSKPQFALL